MAYKILYIEDQIAASIEDDLKKLGYDVKSNDADKFDELMDAINDNYDAYILDYRLTANKGRLDAPALAQTMRTKGNNYKAAPIFLISYEDNLREFDKDLTSQDLFDFAVSKKEFRQNLPKYSERINSFILAYKCISESDFDLKKVLAISSGEIDKLIDYRLIEKLGSEKIKEDTYAYCRFINISLIRCIGPLVGIDILSARLGVCKESKDWGKLLDLLEKFKYRGILSDVYNRWWMEEISNWWTEIAKGKSLRRLNSKERVAILSSALDFDLNPIEPIKHSKSTNFWSICSDTKQALDPSEGYIIDKKDLAPWQELEYLSLYAALDQSIYRKYLSPIDREEIRNIEKDGTLQS
ncbi:MAG TPA: hypothetical protein DEA97_06480 [Bacteroidales bacterium]|nr:MAG: hypothetical protein UR43_C0021G0004 [candidate division TM6 bacterium GW2011_GWF2_33_332]OFY79622.1 MAG: hypothetical protein A2281_13425 [Bacteroidetes bacterium RIFOXYA12_FULL_38_20]HBS86181.1 hypothetical protein [Bacteroidales bacterium]